MSTPAGDRWNDLARRTQKVAAVTEAVKLLDRCWHDLDVMRRYFADHDAMTDEFMNEIVAMCGHLTERSDHYGQWLGVEAVKLDAAIRDMENRNE